MGQGVQKGAPGSPDFREFQAPPAQGPAVIPPALRSRCTAPRRCGGHQGPGGCGGGGGPMCRGPGTQDGGRTGLPKNSLGGVAGGGGAWCPFSHPPPLELAPRAGSLVSIFFMHISNHHNPPPIKGPHATRARHQRQALSLKNIEPHRIPMFRHFGRPELGGGGVPCEHAHPPPLTSYSRHLH